MTFIGFKRSGGRLAAKSAAMTVAFCLMAGAGTAYAYWATVGTGSGSAASGTMQTVIVDALVAGDSPQTVPRGTADVVLRATNPNTYPVQVYGVAGNGAATADAGHPACLTTGVTLTAPPSPLVPNIQIPANSSVLITLPGAATMSSASQSACRGATFHLPVTMEART